MRSLLRVVIAHERNPVAVERPGCFAASLRPRNPPLARSIGLDETVAVAGIASASVDFWRAVALDELIRVAWRWARNVRNRPAPAIAEADVPVWKLDDRVPALVQEAVVAAAEQDEVVELRLPASRPV